MKKLAFSLFAFFIWMCNAQAQENFANAWPTINYYTKTPIRVAVVDEREYVKSGKKDSSYTGAIRSNYGIPYSVYTASGGPVADDVEKAIANGLSNAGINAEIADVASKSSRRSSQPGEKLLLVTLSEWVSDSYQNSVGFSHKLTASIFDQDGVRIASVSSEGSKTFSSPLEGGRDALNQLLTDATLVSAITQKGKTSDSSSLQNTVKAGDKGDAKSRLVALKALLDSGVITQVDYERKKQEILSTL